MHLEKKGKRARSAWEKRTQVLNIVAVTPQHKTPARGKGGGKGVFVVVLAVVVEEEEGQVR